MTQLNEKILEFLDAQKIDTEESFIMAVENLRHFGRKVWIGGAVGAISKAFDSYKSEYFSSEMKNAYRAAENWLEKPNEKNAAAARRAEFDPGRLWMNCNDFRHVSTIALCRLIKTFAEDDEESFKFAKSAMQAMTHPLVFDENEIWSGIDKRIRNLIN